MTTVTFYRAEEHAPDHAGDAKHIAGWVGYLRTITTPLGAKREIEAMVPVYVGAACDVNRGVT